MLIAARRLFPWPAADGRPVRSRSGRLGWGPAACLGVGLLLNATPAAAQAPAPSPQDVVLVVGAGGAEEFAAAFQDWAARWRAAAESGSARLAWIGPSAADSSGADSSAQVSDRERLRQTLQELPNDGPAPVWLVLIGHGTFDGQTARFNLRGPDVAAQELAAWCDAISRPLVLVNCASASAPFIERLAGPSRVVVTATKSGYELNYARFGDYLSQMIGDLRADLDKDQQVSLLEAFVAASKRTEEFYRSAGRLATEHALLEDNGDGKAVAADWFRGVRPVTKAQGRESVDGDWARRLHLRQSEADRSLDDVQRQRRDDIEQALETLRSDKGRLPESAYFAELEALAVELAKIYEEAESRDSKDRTAPRPATESDS